MIDINFKNGKLSFKVMRLQKDLVDIEYHIKPLINVKDNTKGRY